MEDTLKNSGVENGGFSPPPYPGKEQDTPIYPGGLQQGTTATKNPGEMQEMTPVTIVQTQSVVRVANMPDPPLESYLCCSIFVLIFCCLPFGIVAVVYASQQKSRLAVGDVAGARLAHSQAKRWSIAGFFTGLVLITGILLWVFLADPYYY